MSYLLQVLLVICCLVAICCAQPNPGVRLVLNAMSVDNEELQTYIGAAVNMPYNAVVIVSVTNPAPQSVQVDFTYAATDGKSEVQLLTQFKAAMDNPNSDGYIILHGNYAVTSITYYGIGPTTSGPATTTILATTTTPIPTLPPTAWFTFIILMESSTAVIDEAAFRNTIASATGVAASRVYIIEISYFDTIFANVTASFTHSSGSSASQPDLVAILRREMATAGSQGAAAIRKAYDIQEEVYVGYTPTIPLIIVTSRVNIPNIGAFKTNISNAVGVSSTRVNVTQTSRGEVAGIWNYTFIFTDGTPSSLFLAQELQKAFFYRDQPAYTTYLAPLNSPWQYFSGLAPLVAVSTTTTAVPIPAVRAVFKILLSSTSQQISESEFIEAIHIASDIPASRFSVFSITYDPNSVSSNVTLAVKPNATAEEPSDGDVLKTVKDILESVPALQARLTFETKYRIFGQTYYGYTPFRPLIWFIYTTSTGDANAGNTIKAIAKAVGASEARIGLIGVDWSANMVSTGIYNFSFKFTNPVTSNEPSALSLTVALQLAFFNGNVDLQSSQQYFESLVALTTQPPVVEKNIRWVISRKAEIDNATFKINVANALEIDQSRVTILQNSYNSAAETVTLRFSFTDVLEGTAQSRYNLTYDLMYTVFLKEESPQYNSYLSVYTLVSQSYGDWVTILTKPPASTNPIITFSMISPASFNFNSFAGDVASAVGAISDRIANRGQTSGGGLLNCSFQFVEAANENQTAASKYVDLLYLMMRYKRDDEYIAYLERYNVTSVSFPNYVAPPLPVMPLITITVSMNWTGKITKDDGSVEDQYTPVDLERFKEDFCTLVSVSTRRFGYEDPPQTINGRSAAQRFKYLPVAVASKPTSVDLTRSLQSSLASRTGPNIVHIYATYNITGRSYQGLPSITDAAPTTTRNPHLPPGPSYFSPYGPEFNRSGLTDAPLLDNGDEGNSGLIYGIAFGCLGAVVLAAGGTIFVKTMMGRGKNHKATKYAQV